MSKPTETLSKDYAATAETLSAILRKELTYYSCKGYLNPSVPSMITAADRKKLVDWSYGVVDHYQLPRVTVATAMEMVDRFLSVSAGPFALWDVNSDVAKVGKNVLHCQRQFQLLTVAALYSTLKAKDVLISIDELVAACHGVYTKEDIENMELIFQRGLSWRFNDAPITAYHIGHSIISSLVPYVKLPEATWGFLLDKIEYQTELAVRDYYFSTKRPSTIAMAAIFNAVESIGNKEKYNEIRGVFQARFLMKFDNNDLIAEARRRLQHSTPTIILPD